MLARARRVCQTAASAAARRRVHRSGGHAHSRAGRRRAGRRGGDPGCGFAATTIAERRSATRGPTTTDAPGGHNGCDTRNDILDRDLVDKTYVLIKRCPNAVATGTLHDPYTNVTRHVRARQTTGASVQIDHIVPLALAWDLGARNWPDDMRLRFANDPANLLAVAGAGQSGQGRFRDRRFWMPPNVAFWCQYAVQFVAVLRGYGLPIDAPSATVLREAARTCPMG